MIRVLALSGKKVSIMMEISIYWISVNHCKQLLVDKVADKDIMVVGMRKHDKQRCGTPQQIDVERICAIWREREDE